MTKKTLNFMTLSERHFGVTPAVSGTFAEAARVCLDRHHETPQDFKISDNGIETIAEAAWPPADPRTHAGWANRDVATEFGAYGLAIAAVEATRGLVAVARAEKLTGADYYLGAGNGMLEDLENCYRLEVSGTADGNISVIKNRLSQKIEQARNGASDKPAIAAVVGFAALQIATVDVEET
jgi:hypothetical protein